MNDTDCVQFLQDVLPKLRMRWPGFRKVRRQVCKRVHRRLQHLRLEDVAAYREYLNRHPAEWHVLDEFCRITISRFYRDRGVFDLVRDRVLPLLAEAATVDGSCRIRAWIAGCASGEEVYTLKLIWELGPRRGFSAVQLHITATDADPRMLQRARRASYGASSIKDFPAEWTPLAFERSGEELRVRDDFRGGIELQTQDIRHQQPDGPFDLILCRHLAFTHFDDSLQEDVLRRILARLRPGGILLIGKQETLPRAAGGALKVFERHSGIYRLTSP